LQAICDRLGPGATEVFFQRWMSRLPLPLADNDRGKRKWTEDHFAKRLRAEREHRGWSQAEMAKMLSDRGIPMDWTTIAKVEKNDRSVRIDEAAGIADLFGTSVDELLGRKVAPERHMTYPLWL
jgi:ribosome-binding protein aMBF1 (putative translation factor)